MPIPSGLTKEEIAEKKKEKENYVRTRVKENNALKGAELLMELKKKFGSGIDTADVFRIKREVLGLKSQALKYSRNIKKPATIKHVPKVNGEKVATSIAQIFANLRVEMQKFGYDQAVIHVDGRTRIHQVKEITEVDKTIEFELK